ncbi:hypothetical protein [Micrococcus luteus]|nr:hypothetical protein [Micrococcus luteus]UTT45783.1 hypothetical protein NMQ02_00605 [Micrococcus luteus]
MNNILSNSKGSGITPGTLQDDKLDERFDTKLIFKPEQLVEALVAASL